MKRSGSELKGLSQNPGPERFLASQKDRENYLFLLNARDQIRGWLKAKKYLEVLIPALSTETVPDLNLETFSVAFKSVFDAGKKRELFLQTSPELLIKRLLASGFSALFYLGPVFRQGELAEKHHPEFTMVEWYRTGCTYLDLMSELEDMLSGLFAVKKPIEKITMRDALLKAAGIDFIALNDRKKLGGAIKTRDRFFKARAMDWPELFEYAVVKWLDPWLQSKDAIFVYDWPEPLAMQARLKSEGDWLVAERFELYLRGIEIANGYTELTDAAEMEKRFSAEIKKRKKLKRKITPLPKNFLASLKLGMPDSAGVSLGLERLCLALLGLNNLDQLIAFREI